MRTKWKSSEIVLHVGIWETCWLNHKSFLCASFSAASCSNESICVDGELQRKAAWKRLQILNRCLLVYVFIVWRPCTVSGQNIRLCFFPLCSHMKERLNNVRAVSISNHPPIKTNVFLRHYQFSSTSPSSWWVTPIKYVQTSSLWIASPPQIFISKTWMIENILIPGLKKHFLLIFGLN